jgi:hypothetical protein
MSPCISSRGAELSLSVTDLMRYGSLGENPFKSKKPTRSKTTRQRRARRMESGSHTPSVSATLNERITIQAFANYERSIRRGPLDDWLQTEQRSSDNRTHGMLTYRIDLGYSSEEQKRHIITCATSSGK